MSKDYLLYFEQFLKISCRKSRNIILIGDLNHDLLTKSGNNLKIVMNNQNFSSFQCLPTHTLKESSTCLDVVFCNSPELISSN